MREPRKKARNENVKAEDDLVDSNGISRLYEIAIEFAKCLCTPNEIACKLSISPSKLQALCKEWGYETSGAFCKHWQNDGKASLRQKQFEVAMDGNQQMLIWLGKQYLGQRERSEIKHEIDYLSEMTDEEIKELLPTALRILEHDDEGMVQ